MNMSFVIDNDNGNTNKDITGRTSDIIRADTSRIRIPESDFKYEKSGPDIFFSTHQILHRFYFALQ